jgi:hypothetical protein
MKQEQYDLILPEEVKSPKHSDIENKIFELWNEQGIIKHSKLNADMKKAIKKAMESYSLEEITTSIRHYGLVLNHERSKWNYRWPLNLFLSRSNALPRFIDSRQLGCWFAGPPPREIIYGTIAKEQNEKPF